MGTYIYYVELNLAFLTPSPSSWKNVEKSSKPPLRLSTWNTWHLNVHCARNRFALRGGACSASLPEVKFDYRKKLLHFTTRSGMIPYQQRNQFRFDSRSGTCFALLKQAGLRFADAELARIHCWKRLCVAIQSGTCVSNKAVNFGVFTNQNKFKFIF